MIYLITIITALLLTIESSFDNTFSNVDTIEIVIESNDQMKFDLNEIKVKKGDTIKLTLKHVGQLPKAAMGHNWVLLNADTDMASFAQAAIQARDNDYIPADGFIIHTDLLGGGEETTIEFEAPEIGEYTFICSFPGHFALMNGKFIVE
jgi:azurin